MFGMQDHTKSGPIGSGDDWLICEKGKYQIMSDILGIEYERAKCIFETYMGMVIRNVARPNRKLVRCFTHLFNEVLDGLRREQFCLIEALRRKEQRIDELEADTWAELEEV